MRINGKPAGRAAQLAAVAVMLLLPYRHGYAQDRAQSLSFVVLGHVRGGEDGKLTPLLPQLVADVRRLKPDVVFLTGDMIWGEVHDSIVERAKVERQWQQLDSALAGMGAPIYRVPGNHDINDPVTRDIFMARYGRVPRVIDQAGVRFLLLNSAYMPEGNGPTPKQRTYVRGKALDSASIAFVRAALADTASYTHAFVLLHHLLWWGPQASWWQDVHPLLVGRKVRAVIGGDLGPMKFSHQRRDSIDYIQTSIEGMPNIARLRKNIDSRLLSQQFDNYLGVRVSGPTVDLTVHTLAAIGSNKFTPDQWRAINRHEPSRAEQLQVAWDYIKKPANLLYLALLAILLLGAGVAVGRFTARRPDATARR